MKRFDSNLNEGHLGFQIAPMIDVVFVIMLFFMVTAGGGRVGGGFSSPLSRKAGNSNATDFVDEQIVQIAENGEVSLNEEPMDTKDSRELPKFTATMTRLKVASDQAKSPCMVTVASEPTAKYARIIDVLDALSVAGVSNVTFTIGEEP